MNTVQNQQFQHLFQSLHELSVMELDELMAQIVYLRRQKLPTVLSESETELLHKINKGLPSSIQKRYNFLINRRKAETLLPTEYEELLELTAYTENHNAQRLAYLLELAKLRNQTLDEIITALEIKPRLYVA
ncbi:MAG: hypothetical protein MUE81_20030 [Thermoflexibacter sp.]|jgi:hypothetical protein|nr:hypothetical protein [Thermoflexibacter sp.]